MTAQEITLSEQLKKLPPGVRSIVQAARRTVKAAAPNATESTSQSEPPRSKTYMWKLVRYKVDGRDVVGIGAPLRDMRAWSSTAVASSMTTVDSSRAGERKRDSSGFPPQPTRSGRTSLGWSGRRSSSDHSDARRLAIVLECVERSESSMLGAWRLLANG